MSLIAGHFAALADLYLSKAVPEPFWLLWPVAGSVVSQGFGANPAYYGRWFKDANGNLLGHEGIDLAGQDVFGMPVEAAAPGTVYRVETVDNSNYGLQVRIEHTDGFKTTYAHLSRVDVLVGDRVRRGEMIGRVGNSGNSTGAHLHFVLKNNGATARGESRYQGTAQDIIDPTRYLRRE